MPHYNFIEIGTSNFDTLIQKANNNTVGLSVEPITHYLEQLPNKDNVKKINVAVSFDNVESDVQIYFIPESIIKEHNLSHWLVGCNSINGYQPAHIDYKHLVTTKTIKQIPISKLFDSNNVTSLDLLKIDTEGGDSKILTHFFSYVTEKKIFPKKIQFETNKLTPEDEINSVISLYESIGYRVTKRNKHNTSLEIDT
jgi:hypothetical protein